MARPPIRLLTATAIFDGHDAAINIVRRVLQDQGAEIIHLGHNRSVAEIVRAAIQEDVDGIAVSSYQGGHMEYFKYLVEQLAQKGARHILVFGGGGGTITQQEAQSLESLGVNKIFTADTGLALGLDGMAKEIIGRCEEARKDRSRKDNHRENNRRNNSCIKKEPGPNVLAELADEIDDRQLAQLITELEQGHQIAEFAVKKTRSPKVIGITGTGGSGKSTLIDEMLNALLQRDGQLKIAYLAIDPSRKKTGGALLGDRLRINCQSHPRLYMRSLATRQPNVSISPVLESVIELLKSQAFGMILIETAGIGQSDAAIVELVDESIYVMTRDYGAPSQLEKIEMLDFADKIVLNKCDQQGSEDAYRDICKQWQRNHRRFDAGDQQIPVYPMVASQFNNPGLEYFIDQLIEKDNAEKANIEIPQKDAWWSDQSAVIITESRRHYLAQISELGRQQAEKINQQSSLVSELQHIEAVLKTLDKKDTHESLTPFKLGQSNGENQLVERLQQKYNQLLQGLEKDSIELLNSWQEIKQSYHQAANYRQSLSQQSIPLIALPNYTDQGELLRFLKKENLPGFFPYTSGVYPYRHSEEEPTRMFAGQGTPEDTNRRFFYLLSGQKTIRLSTAFDPVTLYGQDPAEHADSLGCIGMSGVSVSNIDDMKKLYSGIDLLDPSTSVSMTINGPAAIVLAWFFNVVIDQQIEKYLKSQGDWSAAEAKINAAYGDRPRTSYQGELPDGHNGLGLGLLGMNGRELVDSASYEKIKKNTMNKIRGTLQADILKEELAQNECIFSLEFGLRLMADMQSWFIDNEVKRFYGVSVSGYHIAEAGANPVTQLAFTLANGFTLVEYYLSKGMSVDDFAGHFSFFFSNGMDAEYAVLGRVARRIWANTLRYHYAANSRSQKLKYHIQTSGRSLHAQDIELNDVRTTLQALYATYDNCNSLHTNAYDEAVTTPTQESVHRALAIQVIINRELGLNINQNPLQGAFLIDQLTDKVEQAVYEEFDCLSKRGGVMGAMESFYQRNAIQQQSLYYESKKNDASLPIVGVNVHVFDKQVADIQVADKQASRQIDRQLVRCSDQQKQQQLMALKYFKENHQRIADHELQRLKQAVLKGENSFQQLMETVWSCSLGQIVIALKEVGGHYRRKM